MFWTYFQAFYIDRIFGSAYIVKELIFILACALFSGIPRLKTKEIALFLAKLAVFWLFIQIFGGLSYWLLSPVEASGLVTYTAYPVLVLLDFVFLCRYKWEVKVVFGLFFYSVMVASSPISIGCAAICRLGFGMAGENSDMVTPFAQALLIVAVVAVMLTSSLDSYNFIPRYAVILFSCVSVIYLAIAVFCMQMFSAAEKVETGIDPEILSFLITVSFFLIQILTFFLFSSVAKSYDRIMLIQRQNEQNDYVETVSCLRQSQYEEMQKFRHDLVNQITFMSKLVDDGKIEELQRYFAEYAKDAANAISHSSCGNTVIDNILDIEQVKAQKSSLSIDSKIAVPPQLSFREKDMAGLLMNILDNAIEACHREGIEGEAIHVDLRQREGQLFIRIDNPVGEAPDREERLTRRTSKQDTAAHGYGRLIIRQIAEKYNGFIQNSIESNRYVVDVVLICPEAGGAA